MREEAKSRGQGDVTSRANTDGGPESPQNQRWYVLRGCDGQGDLRIWACFYGKFKRTKERRSNGKNQTANSWGSLPLSRGGAEFSSHHCGFLGGRGILKKSPPNPPPILLCSVMFWALHSVPSLGHCTCCRHFGLCWNKGGRHFDLCSALWKYKQPQAVNSLSLSFGFRTSIG